MVPSQTRSEDVGGSSSEPPPETRWTLVARAAGSDDNAAKIALRELCGVYHGILLRVARRRMSEQDARDAVHDFVVRMLDGKVDLSYVNRDEGKFSTYLWKTFNNFMVDRHRRETSQQAGGGNPVLSIERVGDGESACLEPIDSLTPEQEYHEAWAQDIVNRAVSLQREKWERQNEMATYELLLEYLLAPCRGENAKRLAGQLGITESGARRKVADFRVELRSFVRKLVADTLKEPTEANINEELTWLKTALQC